VTDALPYWFDAALFAALAFAILQLSTIGRSLMSTQAAVDAVVAQLVKARGEIVAAKDQLVAKIVDLQNQLDAGVPAEQVDLSGLKAVAQSLDDIVPDAVEEYDEDEDDDEVVVDPADPFIEDVTDEAPPS
jgi:cell division protein FtsB